MEELDRVFEKVSHYFSLLSEPTRLRILHALCGGERSVNEVVTEVGSSQTNVSRHLGAMYQAGVLARRRDGNQVYYAIADTGVVEICRAVCTQVAGRIEEEALPERAVDGFMPRGS
ncbi:winged helix-turn-helix transcriptional regulator [Pandoraea pnomenusa]|uniref:ArsR/SmtB family transcription factor n=1 Tax=Pandoraea pnomenusa TaxID=93220 RepID=UPI00119830E7|nr:metalloregulator ArsR/SmtB family transcription factor [Pandoraea pnomenusa]QDX23848.1 winged helix-turn-helix transcriptional regulator [Pandoraea pnomenusa]